MYNLYIQFKDNDRPEELVHWSITNSLEQILDDFFYYKGRAGTLNIELVKIEWKPFEDVPES